MTFLIIILVIVGGLAFYVSKQPDTFSVTRSMSMSASPDRIFDQINNFHKWEAWSPWAKLDPNSQSYFTGAESGVNACMSWEGNHKVGKGAMTITESIAPKRIKFRLDFEKPMKGTNTAEFNLTQQGSTVLVTWSMTGESNVISKIMSLFFSCEKIVGGQFDKGLTNLKAVVESA